MLWCVLARYLQEFGIVSLYMANPGKVRGQLVKWILRYLRDTTNVGLVYDICNGIDSSVIGFVEISDGLCFYVLEVRH
jgi:hypothetical protein